MILVQILLNASMNGFGERYSIYGKSGAIKYSTHLDKFSYFPKHYNFHEIMSRPKIMKLKFVFSQST